MSVDSGPLRIESRVTSTFNDVSARVFDTAINNANQEYISCFDDGIARKLQRRALRF